MVLQVLLHVWHPFAEAGPFADTHYARGTPEHEIAMKFVVEHRETRSLVIDGVFFAYPQLAVAVLAWYLSRRVADPEKGIQKRGEVRTSGIE